MSPTKQAKSQGNKANKMIQGLFTFQTNANAIILCPEAISVSIKDQFQLLFFS